MTLSTLDYKTRENSLEKFVNLLRKDGSLQEILKTASDVNSFVALVIDLGKKYGYHLTAEEVQIAVASVSLTDLNEQNEVMEPDEKLLLNVAGVEHASISLITDNQDTLSMCNCPTARFTDFNCGPCR